MIETQGNMPVKRRHLGTATGSFLSFDDYKNMHLLKALEKRQARWVPPFVFDPAKFRRVLLVRAWRYAFTSKPVSEEDIDWTTVNKAATERALGAYNIIIDSPKQREWHAAHVAAVKRAGGFCELEAAVMWRCWIEGMSSVDCAETLGITPCAVRQHLNRSLNVARELYPNDCGEPHPTRGRKKQ